MHDPAHPKARVFHTLERLFSGVGTTITMSRCESSFADQIIGIPTARQVVCGNGVDFTTFRPPTPEGRRALHAQFGLPDDAKILGSVGRFSPQKDPATMYVALADAMADLPDLFFIHVGQGELESRVDALIASRGLADRCKRLPYLNDTSPFYQVLDGFLLTSLYEGMSYAVLEALAANLPLVLTHAPGNNDFADHGFSHIEWCEPSNAPSITRAIHLWHAALSRGEVPNHREVARQSFSLDVCFTPIRDAYLAALGSRSGAP
jgi:glycosyltransferase involved in cell wall biosynthesis